MVLCPWYGDNKSFTHLELRWKCISVFGILMILQLIVRRERSAALATDKWMGRSLLRSKRQTAVCATVSWMDASDVRVQIIWPGERLGAQATLDSKFVVHLPDVSLKVALCGVSFATEAAERPIMVRGQ